MKKLLIALGGAVLMVGCSTVSMSEKGSLSGVDVKGAGGHADRTLCVSNEGCWLFNSVPLLSTSMTWDERKQCISGKKLSFFKDETGLQRITDVFYRYADREGCDVVDLVVDNRTKFPIGLFGLFDWIGNVFFVREVAITGVLKERN